MSWAAVAMTGVSIIGGAISGGKAKRAKEKAAEEQARKNAEIKAFENSRQDPMNPYSESVNLAGMVKDLSGKLSNPFDNIGVATKAAEFTAEQTDMALAATLDTLQATGASAGGATALANAAAKSKQKVAATLEAQEAKNEQLRAQGEMKLQQMEMGEAARVQGMQINATSRFQDQQAKGKQFQFQVQEARDNATLDRLSGQEAQARMDMATAQQAQNDSMNTMISGIGSGISTGISSGSFDGGGDDSSTGGGQNESFSEYKNMGGSLSRKEWKKAGRF